jgi:hypothetical protein
LYDILMVVIGSKGGPGWHSRYFQLKGLGKPQKQTFIHKHAPEYTASVVIHINMINSRIDYHFIDLDLVP